MPTRNKRLLQSGEIEQILVLLSQGRTGAIQVCRNTKPFGPEYKAAEAVQQAIDDLAGALGKDRDYFHTKPHG